MKYIVIENSDEDVTIHIWNERDSLTHKDMFEAIQRIRINSDNSCRPLMLSQVRSAGFYDGKKCDGFSYSIGIGSLGEEDLKLIAGH